MEIIKIAVISGVIGALVGAIITYLLTRTNQKAQEVIYTPGTGKIRTYSSGYENWDEKSLIQEVLDGYSIPYRFAKLKSKEKQGSVGQRRTFLYTIEYWD